MPFAWSILRNPPPTVLAAARTLAHRAAQWPSRAARANLAPAADDGHASLTWDAGRAALLSQPLDRGVRVGLRVGVHELVFIRRSSVQALALAGAPDAEVGNWLDGQLAEAGLQPASAAKLPYDLPPALFARAADEAPRLAALGGWFAAGTELLDELRAKHRRYRPGPLRCWPQHFNVALLVELEADAAPPARAIAIGFSPGDGYYAQPYFYVSPYPRPDTGNPPPLPPGGRWHTRDFFGAIATGVDLLALPDPGAGLLQVIDAAFEESLRRLKGGASP